MEDYLIKGLSYLAVALINVVIYYVAMFLRKHKVVQELNAHKELVKIAVVAIQQAYESLDGSRKFELAKDWVINAANEKGLKISDKEIEFLIDSTVKELKTSMVGWEKIIKINN